MTTTPCSVCGAPISKSNMSRHLKHDHPDHADSQAKKFRCRKTNDSDGPPTSSSTSSKETSIAPEATGAMTTVSTVPSTVITKIPISSTATKDSASTQKPSPSASESTFGAALLVRSNPPPIKKKPVNKMLSLESSSSAKTPAPNQNISATSPALVISDDATPLTVNQKYKVTQFLHGDLKPSMASIIAVASRDVLDAHDCYDVPSLTALVKQGYTNIPPDVIPYMVIAATTAAKHVAQLHLQRDSYRNADNLILRQHSETVLASMLSWAHGIRRPDPMCPSPFNFQPYAGQHPPSSRSLPSPLKNHKEETLTLALNEDPGLAIDQLTDKHHRPVVSPSPSTSIDHCLVVGQDYSLRCSDDLSTRPAEKETDGISPAVVSWPDEPCLPEKQTGIRSRSPSIPHAHSSNIHTAADEAMILDITTPQDFDRLEESPYPERAKLSPLNRISRSDGFRSSRIRNRRSPSPGPVTRHQYRPYQPAQRWGDNRRGWRHIALRTQYDRFCDGRRRDTCLRMSPSRDADTGRSLNVYPRSGFQRPGQPAITSTERNASRDEISRQGVNPEDVHTLTSTKRTVSPHRLQVLLRIEEQYNKLKSGK